MNKTKIEWTDWTWNPYTGCKRGCHYYYARNLDKRFGYDMTPQLRLERLKEIQAKKVKPGDKVFVCSTADLFGEWVNVRDISKVIMATKERKDLIYQYLTKNPARYDQYLFNWNSWLGATVTQGVADTFKTASFKSRDNIRFVSCEPLLGPIEFRDTYSKWDWIIVGAMTGPKAKKYAPKTEWIKDIISYAGDNNIPLFIKNNLITGKFYPVVREYPKEIQPI